MDVEQHSAPSNLYARIEARSEIAKGIIADLRARLLNLTTRNRLLSFNFGQRARQVRIVNEVPDALFKRLVTGSSQVFQALPQMEVSPQEGAEGAEDDSDRGADEPSIRQQTLIVVDEVASAPGPADKPAGRRQKAPHAGAEGRSKKQGSPPSVEEWAREQGINPSYDLPSDLAELGNASPPDRNTLQLLLFPEQMDRKLRGIREGARIALSEMGINILFLAFGFLEWTESADSDRKYFAPLLLHPVDMQRKLVRRRYRYSISSAGDETMTNDTLRTRLRNDFGLALPDFEETDTPEKYFDKVNEVIKEQKDWKVRRFVALGLFPFGRIAMYHDLDPERWPEDRALHRHPVLLDLLTGGGAPETLIAEDYETDAAEIAAKVPILITEADSSQFSAIADVMDGRNLVIQGPPGTGKSQTITNIIAAALYLGKRVLFVAEKMAALEVVKKRLDDAGLGEFCLELHSTKARRGEVLESLRRRLELTHDGLESQAEHLEDELRDLIRELHRYATELNSPFGAMDKTLQQSIWAYLRAQDEIQKLKVPKGLHRVQLDDPAQTTRRQYNDRQSLMESLAELGETFEEKYGAVVLHPWFGINVDMLTPFEQDELKERIACWHAATEALHELVQGLGESGVPLSTFRDVNTAKAVTDILRRPDVKPILSMIDWAFRADGVKALRHLERDLQRYDRLRARGEVFFAPGSDASVGSEDVAQLINLWERIPQDVGVDGVTLADMKQALDRIDNLIRDVQTLLAEIDTLNQRLGLDVPATLTALEQLSTARHLVIDTPKHVLEMRRPSLFEPSAAESLKEAIARAEQLKRQEQVLADIFVMRQDEDVQALRDAAVVLRSETGLLSRLFSRRYKEAVGLWRGLRRETAKMTASEMAHDLDKLAQHHLAKQQMQRDETLRALCGPSYQGVATNFEALLAVVEFGRVVRRRFPETDATGRRLAQFLLQGDPEIIKVMAETGVDLVDAMKAIVDRAAQFSVVADEHTELSAVLERLISVAADIKEVCTRAAGLDVIDRVTKADLDELVSVLTDCERLQVRIGNNKSAAHGLGEHFRGIDTERDLTGCILATTEALANASQRNIVDALLKIGVNEPRRLDEVGVGLRQAIEREQKARRAVEELSSIDWLSFVGDDNPLETEPVHLLQCISRVVQHASALPQWVDYRRLYTEAEKLGLAPIIDLFVRDEHPMTALPVAYRWVFFRSLLSEIYRAKPGLSRLSGIRHDNARERFKRADEQLSKEHRLELVAELSNSDVPWGNSFGPKKMWTDLALINNELAKQRGHVPLRDLFQRAEAAILALKPCWMMSPSSVAHFLAPGSVEFDLVVIDEASQMRPEEALGAVARGRQLVVVGDPMQLPPTDFFRRYQLDPDDEDDEDEDAVDSESILDLAQRTFHPVRRLRWHYRSRHEDLIAFSNKEFYDESLIIFPSAHRNSDNLGVKYVGVNGLYHTGQHINPIEARAVADAAIEFMKRFPKKSLGIVCINKAQTELLVDEMSLRVAQDADAARYIANWEETLEPFFVKNLENVQGDERDVIFISTVYGPETEGGRVAQRFGPINSRVGHRRLNVLFTRAKEQIKVFSSLKPSDIVLTPTSHRGVRVLQSYLSFAQSGFGAIGKATGREPDSDFEVFVAERLRTHGYDVVPQVGVDGYFIDIGVLDPSDSSRYLAGVECDGATYHSAKSARDRDRLRQERLEMLGWRIYRIWSVDWFADPDREVEKLLQFLDRLRK